MQTLRISVLILTVLTAITGVAQQPDQVRIYLETYREFAIAEMQRSGVPAAIKLAQGIHETGAGTSELVLKSNNHFGIKCKSDWKGETVSHTDDAPHECFRKYEDPSVSYRDHSDFLRKSSRYASLFELDPLDYQGWAHGLKKAGYATNPKYPLIIIRLIETYHLQDYSLMALGKMDRPGNMLAKNNKGKDKDVELFQPPVIAKNEETFSEPEKTYPSGEFRINNTRVIYVRGGTSLLSIALQYNIPLARVFEFNEMPEADMLAADKLIYLQRKRKTGDNEFHIVKSGESLHDIAQEEGIRIESLLEYNHLERNMQPAPGEKLFLRKKAPAVPRLAVNSEMTVN